MEGGRKNFESLTYLGRLNAVTKHREGDPSLTHRITHPEIDWNRILGTRLGADRSTAGI